MSRLTRANGIAGLIFLIVLAIVAFAIAVVPEYYRTPKLEALELGRKIEKLEEEKSKLATEVETYKKLYEEAQKDDQEDFRKYILYRYSKVPTELAELIATHTDTLTQKVGVDFSLVVGVMEVESAFNPFAESKKGAIGLMQVMPTVWAGEFDVVEEHKDLYGIKTNIEVGCEVLKHYLEKREGNVARALKDYNGGGSDYAKKVYVAVGRFTAFRNNTYLEADENANGGEETSVGDAEGAVEASESDNSAPGVDEAN